MGNKESKKQSKTENNDKLTPLAMERGTEEAACQKAMVEKKQIICRQRYQIDTDNDFIQVLHVGEAMNTALIMCVQIKDIKNVHYKEAQAIQACLKLGERGTQGSLDDFRKWHQKLKTLYDNINYTEEPSKNRNVIVIKFGAQTQNFSKGKTQNLSISVDNDGGNYCVFISF